MIGTSSFVSISVLLAFSVIAPIAVAIWWVKKHNERISTVIAGAATWLVFAIILESIPKAVFFDPDSSLGSTVLGNPVLYTIIGCLLAGIFEETGRLVMFSTILRKRTNKETAISHGIGHGGFEAMFLMVNMAVQYLVFASMINAGTFDAFLENTAATGADISALQTVPDQLMAWTAGTSILSIIERIFAILLHIGLSVIVFHAVRDKKPLAYILAVVLHALFDVPAALYQFGVISEMYIIEIMLGVYSILFFIIMYKCLYLRMSAAAADTDSNSQRE